MRLSETLVSSQDRIQLTSEQAIENFNKAIAKGLVKVMNKIGISTLHLHRGAGDFEALGLNKVHRTVLL